MGMAGTDFTDTAVFAEIRKRKDSLKRSTVHVCVLLFLAGVLECKSKCPRAISAKLKCKYARVIILLFFFRHFKTTALYMHIAIAH